MKFKLFTLALFLLKISFVKAADLDFNDEHLLKEFTGLIGVLEKKGIHKKNIYNVQKYLYYPNSILIKIKTFNNITYGVYIILERGNYILDHIEKIN